MRDDGTPEYVMVHQNGPVRFSERSDYLRYEPPERADNWKRDSALGGVHTIELDEEADGTRMVQRARQRQVDTMVERLVHHDRYCTVGDHRCKGLAVDRYRRQRQRVVAGLGRRRLQRSSLRSHLCLRPRLGTV